MWRPTPMNLVLWWDKRGERSSKRESELSMASKLLDRVVVPDRVVTGDALYCNRNLCQQVMEAGGDYLMAVKVNQKSLYEDVELCFVRGHCLGSTPMLRQRAGMETVRNIAGCGLRIC